MHVCCCWIREGRVAKDKLRLQQNCTLTMHYSNKHSLHVLRDSVHCPLTSFGFFVCYVFLPPLPKKKEKWQGCITQPTVNNTDSGLCHLKSVQWFSRHLRQTPLILHILSLPSVGAVCLGRDFFSLSCDVLIWPVNGAIAPATARVATESFCCITVFLYMLFFFFFFILCVPVITEWLCMELDHNFDIVTVEKVANIQYIWFQKIRKSNERSNCSNRECV